MAVSRDATQDCTSSTTNGTSRTASWPASPPAAKLLLAGALLSTTIAHVGAPSGYTLIANRDDLSGTFSVHLYGRISDGTETGVTFNMTGQPNGDVYVAGCQLSGAIVSSVAAAIDKTASNTNGGSQVTTLPTGTFSTPTAQADDYLFALMGFSGPISAPSWANGSVVHSMNKLVTGQRIVAASAAYSDALTWTSPQFPSGLIAAIKAAPVVASAWWTST